MCNKIFAFNGKHGLHENKMVQDYRQKVKEDDMFNYQCSFVDYGLIVYNLFDAIKEGNGDRVISCWKFMLPHLKHDGSRAGSMLWKHGS